MKKTYIYYSTLFVVFIISITIGTSVARADEKCIFTDTLESGSVGENVRCLQKYLNANGFIVSSSGVGSSGYETDTFRDKTKEAVKKWQIANGIYPATGNFGPLSRSVYEVLVVKRPVVTTTSGSSTGNTSSGTSNTTTVVSSGSVVTVPATTNTSSAGIVVNSSTQEKKVRDLMKKVRDAINEADDEIENAQDDGTDVTDMLELAEKAKDKLIDGVYLFIDGEYEEALTVLTRAQKYSDDSVEDIVDDKNKEDAEEAIQDAKDALNSVRDDISEADDDGDDVDEAMDIYNDAKVKYNKARESYDDEDYDEAIDLANEAEDMADEAGDAL